MSPVTCCSTAPVRAVRLATSTPWLRFGASASLVSAISLLWIAIVRQSVLSFSSALLEVSIVLALLIAVSLGVCSLLKVRSAHEAILQAFQDTDREFSSIFQNVLDGILIVDDDGVCLDANPAAVAILRSQSKELVGNGISRFIASDCPSQTSWTTFLQESARPSSRRIVARDGTQVFVNFTTAFHYLPGRHVLILCDVTERTHAEMLLRESEERLRLMANNIQEIFWMMDATTQDLAYVNNAYESITGYPVATLRANPSSYRELIHPEDRLRVISMLHETVHSGKFDEEFRFTRADGVIRWIWAKGFPVRSKCETRWLVGIAQDITSRKQAELKIVEQLDAVEAARAEAEALRKATLALSQNLAMDSVLDTLLHCISELIPFDRATVLFVEDGLELMVARESPRVGSTRMGLTLKASESAYLQRLLFERQAVLLADTSKHTEWRDVAPLGRLQSWMGVPLIAGGNVLGILSLGAAAPGTFTIEHFRLAKSLSIPAAVAIQNARIHERAAIYAAELEVRLRHPASQ
jgi:PAS domain S-box-containing protein